MDLVRILIVTDDGLANGGFLQWRDQANVDALASNSREFHLGEFVRVLQDTQWVGFDVEITRAHRTGPGMDQAALNALKADRGADVVGFRFDKPFSMNGDSRTIAQYDVILFFPIAVGNADTTLASEAEAIAQFMESGGGFFATGDHENLGGQLAALIPRVRSMRRWYYNTDNHTDESPPGPHGEPPAPPALGAGRHDTTRPGLDNIEYFENQSDAIPQPIEPAYYNAGLTVRQGFPARKYLPHALLCSPDGAVTWLPDHMHEGTCEVPDNLAARTFTVGGEVRREYPDYLPPNPPPGYFAEPLAPEIVATGSVLPKTKSPKLDSKPDDTKPVDALVRSFGVNCAWDGHRVNKGRVVVDSTWHHFFNINLTGDRHLEIKNLSLAELPMLHGFYVPDGVGGRMESDEYKMIQWYYRNIVYWLIPASRTKTFLWSALQHIGRGARLREELGAISKPADSFTKPEDLARFDLGHYLYFGQLAQAYLDSARGACASYEIMRVLTKPKIPWWEWVEEFVDIWDPARGLRNKDGVDARVLGAWGVGPQPEAAMTLSLGAAMLTLAFVGRQVRGDNPASTARAAQELFPSVLDHALDKFGEQLALGAEIQRSLQQVIADQLGATRDGQ